MYLLDSNILIYLLSGNNAIKGSLQKLASSKMEISIISRMEVLIGAEKQNLSIKDAENFLDFFENIILDKTIVREAILIAKKVKTLGFKDLIIAATAISRKKTLITADKDFLKLPGLKVKFLKIQSA